jgi:hypothetical protein
MYGFDDVRLECGHGEAPSPREAWTTPQMIEHLVPASQANSLLPIGAASKSPAEVHVVDASSKRAPTSLLSTSPYLVRFLGVLGSRIQGAVWGSPLRAARVASAVRTTTPIYPLRQVLTRCNYQQRHGPRLFPPSCLGPDSGVGTLALPRSTFTSVPSPNLRPTFTNRYILTSNRA